MDRSLKWRTIGLLFGVLLCLGLLAPTWPGSSSLPSWFPFKKKISLGLDLQGGMHIVYSIDLDRAVDDKASDIKRDLEARFADDKVDAKVKAPAPSPPSDGDPGIPLGAVTVNVTDPAKKAELTSQVHADYGDTVSERPCSKSDGDNAICIQVSTSFANGIERSALSNAVTTIRERINEKGVAEPSVVEKGENVIVELPGDPDDPVMQETREIISRTAKLEFKVVDDSTECIQLPQESQETDRRCYMKRLYRHVGNQGKEDAATDPKAIELEIKAKIDGWRPEEGGGNHTDYYLEAYDRSDVSVPVEWAKKHGCFGRDSVVQDGKTRCHITGRQVMERYLFGDKLLGEQGLV